MALGSAALVVALLGCSRFSEAEDDAGAGGVSLDGAVDRAVVPDGSPGQDGGTDGAQVTCPPTAPTQLGAFATLIGKVNVHSPIIGSDSVSARQLNSWASDPDCVSGADLTTVAYCQKFWPKTTTLVSLGTGDSTLKPFLPAGCSESLPTTGRDQFLCCGN